jgi:hypothetical protein
MKFVSNFIFITKVSGFVNCHSYSTNEGNCCDKNEIGDEFHYILECNYFNNVRKKYIDNRYRKIPNIIKFGELMSIKNKIKVRKGLVCFHVITWFKTFHSPYIFKKMTDIKWYIPLKNVNFPESNYLLTYLSPLEGHCNGRNYANLELLIDKTSSIYLYVKLKALAS